MAARKTATKSKRVEYWIVNPKGALHNVTRAHAQELLRQVGYRLATDEEIAKVKAVYSQKWDEPIAEPFNPDAELDKLEELDAIEASGE